MLLCMLGNPEDQVALNLFSQITASAPVALMQGASLDHANASTNSSMDDFDFSKESAVERRCSDAFAAVQHFEKTHCLALQHMALPYLQRRPQLVATCLNQAAQLGLKDEVSHDAVLLMDRTMSTGLEVRVLIRHMEM